MDLNRRVPQSQLKGPMSGQAIQMQCNGCMRIWAIVQRSVTLRYLMPDGRKVDSSRCFVFCRDCDGVSEAESLLFRASTGAEIHEARTTEIGLSRLFMRLMEPLKDVQEQRKVALAKRDFLKIRKSAPRCLKCAGVCLSSLDLRPVVHSCGGHLIGLPVDGQAPRFHYRPEIIELSVEGLRS